MSRELKIGSQKNFQGGFQYLSMVDAETNLSFIDNRVIKNMFRFKTTVKEYPCFLGRTYHKESASLVECPAGLVMVPQPYFATSRPDFITNPGAQILAWIDMSSRKNTCTAFRTKRNIILTTGIEGKIRNVWQEKQPV